MREGASHRPLRVLHLCGGGLRGGIGTVLRRLVRYSDPNMTTNVLGGIDIKEEIDYWKDRLPPRRAQVRNVPAVCSWDPRLPGLVLQLVNSLQPDLVHAHGYKADCIAVLAKPLLRPPLVATAYGWTESSPRARVYKWLDFLALRGCDRVIGVSDHICNVLVSAGIPETSVTRVYTGVEIPRQACGEPQRHRRSWRARLGIGEGDVVVGSVGRLSPEKGHGLLLEAFGMARHSDVTARLVIVGQGAGRPTLERQASRLGIRGDVTFVDYLKKPLEVMRAFDIFVLPSLREGFPSVVLEAFTIGLPVVASRVGGVPEMIQDGRDGLLATPGDARDLSGKILSLLQDAHLRELLGHQGFDRVARAFTVEGMVSETLQLYENLVSP